MIRPLEVRLSRWPARPTRCSAAAMLRGDWSWTTRSIAPTSIPSSSEEVATSARPGQEGQRGLDRAHGRRAADALGADVRAARLGERLQALERERQVGAALRSHQRVDLVDDEEPGVGEGRPEPLAGQQDVERL